jgi:hypothetical protein
MEIILHSENEIKIAEIISDIIEINSPQDVLDIIMNADNLGAKSLIIKKINITPKFFDLSSGIAGEILQKFVNYKMKLAITGDFSEYTSKNFRAFIIECNRGSQFFFTDDLVSAKEKLLRK